MDLELEAVWKEGLVEEEGLIWKELGSTVEDVILEAIGEEVMVEAGGEEVAGVEATVVEGEAGVEAGVEATVVEEEAGVVEVEEEGVAVDMFY